MEEPATRAFVPGISVRAEMPFIGASLVGHTATELKVPALLSNAISTLEWNEPACEYPRVRKILRSRIRAEPRLRGCATKNRSLSHSLWLDGCTISGRRIIFCIERQGVRRPCQR
jgi:hypothetical protein